MTARSETVLACYVYGVVPASARLPAQLRGLGPTGQVWLIRAGQIAAVAGEVSLDRPLGTRADLTGHEGVLDALSMRGSRSLRCVSAPWCSTSRP